MTDNNNIIINKLILKITQDSSQYSEKISKDFNDFVKKKIEDNFQHILSKILNKYKFQDIKIEKLNFNIDDIVENGDFSEEKFIDSFVNQFQNTLEHDIKIVSESVNISEQYDNIISGFEKLFKQQLDEKQKKNFIESFNSVLDEKPEIIKDHFDIALKNPSFFENFFNLIPKNTFIKVVSYLRLNNSEHFSHVFSLYNEKVFSSNESIIPKVNPSLQHLNLNEKQINFIRKELRNNKHLDEVLQKDFYFTEQQSNLIKENIIDKNFHFILKDILKLQDQEINLIEQNIKNRNLNVILKNEIKLNDKQIELVINSIGAKDLNYVLKNDLHLNDEQVWDIKKSLKEKTLDEILEVELKLKKDQINLIKKTLGNKSLDFILKNDFKFSDEQILNIKDLLEVKDLNSIFHDKLNITNDDFLKIKESKNIKSLEFILRELLKFDQDKIEKIKRANKVKNLEPLLLQDFKLNRENLKLIQESLTVKDLDFILTNELQLDNEQISLIKNTLNNKSLKSVLNNDLQLIQKKISLLIETLRGNDIEVVLREKLNFNKEKTSTIKNILENFDIDFTLRHKLNLSQEEILSVKKNIENREFGFILKNIFNLDDQQIETILDTLERKKLNYVLEDELKNRNEQEKKIQQNLNDLNLDYVLKNKLKLDADKIKIIKDNVENQTLDFVLVNILKLDNEKIKLIKGTLDVVLQEELKLDPETIRIIKENAKNRDLDFVLTEELKLDEEKVKFVKDLLFRRNIDTVLSEDFDFDKEKIQSFRNVLSKKNLDFILQNDFHLNTEQILLVKECLERKDINLILKDKLHISDEELLWIKESAQIKGLIPLLRDDFKLRDDQIWALEKSFDVKSLETILREELQLNDEQIKLIKYTQDNKYLNSFLLHDLKLTKDQIVLLQENLRSNDLHFVLDQKLNLEESYAKNIEHILNGKDVDFILKFRFKLNEDELILVKKNLENGNYGFILKNVFKLRDQQIETILDTLEKRKLNPILQNEIKAQHEQLTKIQQNIDDLDLDYVLKKKLELNKEQIAIVKENLENKDFDYVLKNNLKLNIEQIQQVKSTLDFILKKKLKFSPENVKFVKETLEKQNLDVILKEKLNLNDEQIQLIKEVAYQKNLDFILKDELELTDEQIDLIKHSLNVKTLDFILRKDLELDEENVKKVKNSIGVKSLDTVLREDLKLSQEQIDLIYKTLNQKDLDYILRNELDLHDNEIELINQKLEQEEEEKRRQEEMLEQEKRKAALMDFQRLCWSNKISNEFINNSFENIVDKEGDKRYILSIIKQLKNSKDILKKVSVITGQKFICYLTDTQHEFYSSFCDLVQKFEKSYTAKKINFDVICDFIETENINKTLTLILNKISKKNNIRNEEIASMAKIINEDLLILFPNKKKEKKVILKRKYVLQPKLIGILKKIFGVEKIDWDFDSSLSENINRIYKENDIQPSEIFLPLTSLENIILSLSYLNSLSGNERSKHLRQTFEDSLVNKNFAKKKNVTYLQGQKEIKENIQQSYDINKISQNVSIQQLAYLSKIPMSFLMEKCQEWGLITHENQILDNDIFIRLIEEFDIDPKFIEKEFAQNPTLNKNTIKIHDHISLSHFANSLNISPTLITDILKKWGEIADINSDLEKDKIIRLAKEFYVDVVFGNDNIKEDVKKNKKIVKVQDDISLIQFANLIKSSPTVLLEKFKSWGEVVDVNSGLDRKNITRLAKEFDIDVEFIDKNVEPNVKKSKKLIKVSDNIPLSQFANLVKISPTILVEKLRDWGENIGIGKELNRTNIIRLGKEYDIEIEFTRNESIKHDDLDILEEILYNTLTDRFVNEDTKQYLEKKYLKNNQEIKILNQHYIKNGGLVLAFPFLQYAFFKLNLTDKNNRLKDETSKSNAAHFIEFLLSKTLEKNNILKMQLNKLLCGIEIGDVIASEYIFNKNEDKKEEEKQIIQSVSDKIFQEISIRWQKVFKILREYDEYDEFKDISDEDLVRQYIFLRDAVINVYGTKENNEEKILYYTMKITTKDYDDEIKNLPWSCDEIFLPYMNYKLYVEYFGGMFYDDK